MKEIIIATNNKHKVAEISKLLDGRFKLLLLSDIGCYAEIPEDQDTLEGNALQKARYIYDRYQVNCFADDTGLEVEALQGKPGVYSARYSYAEMPDIPDSQRTEANISKLLLHMQGQANRRAAFRTVICLIQDGKPYFFEGRVNGTIVSERHGNEGFGYDPVFIPDGSTCTFAEMGFDEKNKISHRAIAAGKLANHLLQL